MFISITRLRLRSWFFLPSFFIASGKVVKQAKESAGFVEGATFVDKKLAFWTVTMWSDGAAMKVFRGQAAHKNSMPSFANWCDEGCLLIGRRMKACFPIGVRSTNKWLH